jgi:FkbM family methyltransferase
VTLLDRIFSTSELQEAPPVLVDVGAAGGVTPVWRRIARHCIGVGFEPDARDASKLTEDNRAFKRWIYCAGLVAPRVDGTKEKEFYLTRSPHCSSLLKPRSELLQDWCFADLFVLDRVGSVPAVTLHAGLTANGLNGIDWLKCDTQGLDLSIFLSLPEPWRRRVLAVEFEPGLIDAYEGEDKFWRTLQAMEAEPFWRCDLQVCKTPRGNSAILRQEFGDWVDKWLPRLAPGAPAWVNARYLRRTGEAGGALDRRGLLLAWVFADLLGQPAHGLMVAREGQARFGRELFEEMANVSRRRLRLAMLRKTPRWLCQRLGLSA